MKNLISFLTLLFFRLGISHNVLISTGAKEELHDPVLDLDGNEIKTGSSYYLWPTFRPGGGVTLYPTANKTCTFGVAQLVFGDGLPVTFSNGGTDLGEVVRESTNLSISFSPGMLFCPTTWKVDDYDEAAKQYFVTAGDIQYGDETTSTNIWFQIRKDPVFDAYGFAFCPKVCEFCAQICTDVGIYVNELGLRRFALDGNFPSTFVFRKFPA